ncbi:MAG: hypothetical protein WCE75_11115 [Terracidiphilus sp.]
MRRRLLLLYQVCFGLSDTLTGTLLVAAPGFALGLMGLRAPAGAGVFLSYIGAFVLAVGLSCLYGVALMASGGNRLRLEEVWLLTAIPRACVAAFVLWQVASGGLEGGWLTVAATDGFCVLVQAVGLRRGWLAYVER